MQTKGFTIVELLVVIVVIGILAAITIVSYNGVQNRAYDTVVQSDMNAMGKAIMMAQTFNGVPPTADEAGLASIIQVSRNAYLDGASGTLAYCRNDTAFSLMGRSVSKNAYYYRATGGVHADAHSGNLDITCQKGGIEPTSTGFQKIWLFNGTSDPKWRSWIAS